MFLFSPSGASMATSVSLCQYKLRIMETRQESSPAPLGPGAAPAEGRHIDLTEDLGQQLEDIISTYQDTEIPAEPEDGEEVTSIKEADARKDQKLEKKMLKNLGLCVVVIQREICSEILYVANSCSAKSKKAGLQKHGREKYFTNPKIMFERGVSLQKGDRANLPVTSRAGQSDFVTIICRN